MFRWPEERGREREREREREGEKAAEVALSADHITSLRVSVSSLFSHK